MLTLNHFLGSSGWPMTSSNIHTIAEPFERSSLQHLLVWNFIWSSVCPPWMVSIVVGTKVHWPWLIVFLGCSISNSRHLRISAQFDCLCVIDFVIIKLSKIWKLVYAINLRLFLISLQVVYPLLKGRHIGKTFIFKYFVVLFSLDQWPGMVGNWVKLLILLTSSGENSN